MLKRKKKCSTSGVGLEEKFYSRARARSACIFCYCFVYSRSLLRNHGTTCPLI